MFILLRNRDCIEYPAIKILPNRGRATIICIVFGPFRIKGDRQMLPVTAKVIGNRINADVMR
jgi:hypothetical protein